MRHGYVEVAPTFNRFLRFVAFVSLAFAPGATAETITWNGLGGTNSWHNAGNWDLNRVPGAGDDVVVPDMTPNVTVTHSSGGTGINSLTSQEAVALSGGTLTIDAVSSLNSGFTLSSSGALAGGGDVTVHGAMSWTAGSMSGSGKTILSSSSSLSLSTIGAKTLSRTLENHSPSVNWTFGSITMNGGTLDNALDGTWTANFTTNYSFLNGGGTNVVSNAGTFNKTGSAFLTASAGVGFNNTGLVNVQAGTLTLSGGGTNFGDIDINAGATLSQSAAYTFAGGAGATGTGTYSLGHTLTCDGPVTLACVTDLTGTSTNLAGAGDVTITGTLNWTRGTMSGIGRTIIDPAGIVNISTGNLKTLSRVMENHSTSINWTGGSITMNGGTLDNALDGTWSANLGSTASFLSGGGTNAVNNAGTFVQDGAQLTVAASVPFNNTGTVNVDVGTLALSGGGTNSSVIDISAGATLSPLAAYTFAGGSSATGAGTFAISRALNFTGPVSLACATQLSGNTTGDISGEGDVTISGAFNWIGGTMSGTGRTIIAPTGSLSLTSANSKTLSRVLENHSPNASSAIGDGSVTFNGGTLENASDATFTVDSGDFSSGGGTNAVNNAGMFINANLVTSSVPFNNTGTVDVQEGALILSGGGTNSGVIDISAGAILSPQAAYTFADGASATGAGAVSLSTSTSTLSCDGAVTLACVTDLTGASSILAGSGDVTITGTLNWTRGTMSGIGRTIIDPAGSLSISGISLKTLSRVLENHSPDAVLSGGLTFASGTLTNEADGTFAASAGMANGGGVNAFDNYGTYLKTGSGFPSIAVPFRNFGGIGVQAGTVTLTAGFDNFADGTLTGGTFDLAGVLQFPNAEIETNQATIILDGAASAIQNTSSANALINFSTNGLSGSFTLENGRDLATATPFENQGDFTIGPGSVLTVSGAYTQTSGVTAVDGELAAAEVALEGGVLTGAGIVAPLINTNGVVAPGGPLGILAVETSFAQAGVGELRIELGGLAAGAEHDQLAVNGTATLGGTLTVELVNGFIPQPGDEFVIVTYNSNGGEFEEFNRPTVCRGPRGCSPPVVFTLNYESTGAVLRASAPQPGDFDHDGDVDLADYERMADCLGGPNSIPSPENPLSSTTECLDAFDMDFDGDIDLADLAEFQVALAN